MLGLFGEVYFAPEHQFLLALKLRLRALLCCDIALMRYSPVIILTSLYWLISSIHLAQYIAVTDKLGVIQPKRRVVSLISDVKQRSATTRTANKIAPRQRCILK